MFLDVKYQHVTTGLYILEGSQNMQQLDVYISVYMYITCYLWRSCMFHVNLDLFGLIDLKR